MSTRSNIVQKTADGKWRVIYVHFDGYLKGLGRMLFTNYQTDEKVTELVDLGDISSVGEVIGEKHPFSPPGIWESAEYNAYQERYGHMCKAYHRDRDQSWEETKPAVFSTKREALEACGQEFVYYWDGAKWWWSKGPDRGCKAPFKFSRLEPRDWEDEEG